MTTANPSNLNASTPAYMGIGGTVQEYCWTWQGQTMQVIYERRGGGFPVLMLPAFSTVSSRAEMSGIAAKLSEQFEAIALDWPGFGQSDRPSLDYRPAIYHQFLQDFVLSVFDQPVAIVAAGHAAGYALDFACNHPDRCSKLVLTAPTWRGPLPTMGAPDSVAGFVRQTVRSPLLGQALYQLNTAPSFLKWMYERHVYTDAAQLTPEFMDQKHEITQKAGARFAPAAFVTGGLDPVHQREDFLKWFQTLPTSIPVMVLIGEQAPPKSKAEMEALATLSSGQSNVQIHRMSGTLGLHEEYAAEVADVIQPFLQS